MFIYLSTKDILMFKMYLIPPSTQYFSVPKVHIASSSEKNI